MKLLSIMKNEYKLFMPEGDATDISSRRFKKTGSYEHLQNILVTKEYSCTDSKRHLLIMILFDLHNTTFRYTVLGYFIQENKMYKNR